MSLEVNDLTYRARAEVIDLAGERDLAALLYGDVPASCGEVRNV